jgi:phospholipid/cholesterol/gamma-HCH transport system ATP-binding protein
MVFRHRLGVALAEIELQNITIKFGRDVVLEDVSFSIAQNQSCVLIGPSGQGKSVLLKMMSGLLKPTSGRVLVQGQDLYKISSAARHSLMKTMGLLFQKNALFDSFTCGENIAFPLREISALNEQEIENKVVEFLEAVGISHAKNLFPDEISGGMQKRLGIARALVLAPKIVFYDDPTAGLDPITSRKIIELMLKLKKENSSTIVTTINDMNRAYELADQIIMVVNKNVTLAGTSIETRNHINPIVRQFVRGDISGPLTGGL